MKRGRKYLRLQADQRLNKNREYLPLLAHLQGLYSIEPGTQFDQAYPVARRLNTLLRHGELLRRRWSDRILETEVDLWKNLSTLNIGLMMNGRAKWQEAEATREDFNIVLTRQDKKFLTSGLFKVIQDAIPSILHYRTMC